MRYFFVPFGIHFVLNVFAQSPEQYIELTVTDTARAPLERVLYFCSVQLDAAAYQYDPMVNRRKQQEKQQRAQDSLCHDQQELEEQLVNAGFSIGTYTSPAFRYNVVAANSKNCGAGVTIEILSEVDLERLVSFVRSKRNVTGTVLSWESNPMADASAPPRLLVMARSQAEQLAHIGSRKLGPMISARDMNDRFDRPATMTFQYDGTPTSAQNALEAEHRCMAFRFALLADENTTGSRP